MFDIGWDQGNHYMTMAYLTSYVGPVNEADDPYPNPNASPSGLTVQKQIRNVAMHIFPYMHDRDEIKLYIHESYGRIGMYTFISWDANYYNPVYAAFYNPTAAPGNHLVEIIGWDDDFPRGVFTTLNSYDGNGAWLCKNSWGTSWGQSGYFWLSFFDEHTLPDTMAFLRGDSSGPEYENAYDTVFQHDALGWCSEAGYGGGIPSAWGANIFHNTTVGTITAIGYYHVTGAWDDGWSHKYYIYTDVVAGQPRSGWLAAEGLAQGTDRGYFVWQLPTPVALDHLQNFSVVMEFDSVGYDRPIAIERRFPYYSSRAVINAGESFMSRDGNDWVDTGTMATQYNICLKALGSVLIPLTRRCALISTATGLRTRSPLATAPGCFPCQRWVTRLFRPISAMAAVRR